MPSSMPTWTSPAEPEPPHRRRAGARLEDRALPPTRAATGWHRRRPAAHQAQGGLVAPGVSGCSRDRRSRSPRSTSSVTTRSPHRRTAACPPTDERTARSRSYDSTVRLRVAEVDGAEVHPQAAPSTTVPVRCRTSTSPSSATPRRGRHRMHTPLEGRHNGQVTPAETGERGSPRRWPPFRAHARDVPVADPDPPRMGAPGDRDSRMPQPSPSVIEACTAGVTVSR